MVGYFGQSVNWGNSFNTDYHGFIAVLDNLLFTTNHTNKSERRRRGWRGEFTTNHTNRSERRWMEWRDGCTNLLFEIII